MFFASPLKLRVLDISRAVAYACSTIDWFNTWPRTALHSVAHRILAKLAVVPSGPQECGVGPKMAASLMRISVDVHGGVSNFDKSKFRTSATTCAMLSKTMGTHYAKYLQSSRLQKCCSLCTLNLAGDLAAKVTMTGFDIRANVDNRFQRLVEGRAGSRVILFAAGTPNICFAEILPGFLAYVPQDAGRTKKSYLHKTREASCVGDGSLPTYVERAGHHHKIAFLGIGKTSTML